MIKLFIGIQYGYRTNCLGYDLRSQSWCGGYGEEKCLLPLLAIKPWPYNLQPVNILTELFQLPGKLVH
jgi:hypothetical protein